MISAPLPRHRHFLGVLGNLVDEIQTVSNSKFLVDVGDVIPDRARGDEKFLTDILVARTPEDQAQIIPGLQTGDGA
jgi:hypothetical protein